MIKFTSSALLIIAIAVTLFFANILLTSSAVANEMPIKVRELINKEGCITPTKLIKLEDYTVKYFVSGEFAHAGQKDFAVICHKKNKVYLKIIWGGKFQCKSEVESFGEAIDVVGKKYILNHYQAYGGTIPSQITHQGIEDIILEKASVIRYCHDGKWLELTGAD